MMSILFICGNGFVCAKAVSLFALAREPHEERTGIRRCAFSRPGTHCGTLHARRPSAANTALPVWCTTACICLSAAENYMRDWPNCVVFVRLCVFACVCVRACVSLSLCGRIVCVGAYDGHINPIQFCRAVFERIAVVVGKRRRRRRVPSPFVCAWRRQYHRQRKFRRGHNKSIGYMHMSSFRVCVDVALKRVVMRPWNFRDRWMLLGSVECKGLI